MKVRIVSLGCPKNTVDSEKFIGLLKRSGFIPAFEDRADLVIINTCGFIKDAINESLEEIERWIEKKRRGEVKFLAAGGCLFKRFIPDIVKNEVDITFLPEDFKGLLKGIESLTDKRVFAHVPSSYPLIPREKIEGAGYAYLKVSEGCSRKCTFCTIPSIRGKYRSFPMEALLEEARTLADEGAKELVVISQDLTLYGADLYGERKLHELLRRLEEIEGIEWLRLLYLHPAGVYEELLKEIERNSKIVPYFELPIQHINERLLKSMGRDGGKRAVLNSLKEIRDAKPGVYIRTEVIVGFPGEGEEEFNELLQYLEETRFERIGVFPFSREEGTPAYNLEGQLDEDEIMERYELASIIASTLMEEAQKKLVGKTIDVIIDNSPFGRTKYDAPLIDFRVNIKGTFDSLKGKIIKAKITSMEGEGDLVGVVK